MDCRDSKVDHLCQKRNKEHYQLYALFLIVWQSAFSKTNISENIKGSLKFVFYSCLLFCETLCVSIPSSVITIMINIYGYDHDYCHHDHHYHDHN